MRRFFCTVAYCPQKIFAERLPEVAPLYARCTPRLLQTHAAVGLALGGEAGARLARLLAMPTSADTLLRRVRQLPLPPASAVRVLGVDDWAFRRGHRYGTLLCDLERQRPIELLPERSATALESWLRQHPEIEILSRDRADDYIKGATLGAPQALQVADRWHLLRNLRDALGRVVERHGQQVQQALQSVRDEIRLAKPTEVPTNSATSPAAKPPTKQQQHQHERRQRRREQYDEVVSLDCHGVSKRDISRRLGLDRGTVRRWLRVAGFPERGPQHRHRQVNSVAAYLRQRWDEGCRRATQLFDELRAQGFDGSYHMVRRCLAPWRQQAGDTPGPPAARGGLPVRMSPRRATWLLLKPESELSEPERRFRARLEEPSRRCAAQPL